MQGIISSSIKVLTKEEINLIGSGRTDTGVHALAQVANFNASSALDLNKFNYSLNSILPDDISVLKTEIVDDSFNSRFDAVSRKYLYVISKIKSPFYNKYSWYLNKKLNIEQLSNLSKCFVGENDFTSFCKKNTDVENKVCNLKSINWKETKNFYIMIIESNRFLHGMVRAIVGTLLKAEENNFGDEQITKIFENKNRESAGEAVPAKGLFLYKVIYKK